MTVLTCELYRLLLLIAAARLLVLQCELLLFLLMCQLLRTRMEQSSSSTHCASRVTTAAVHHIRRLVVIMQSVMVEQGLLTRSMPPHMVIHARSRAARSLRMIAVMLLPAPTMTAAASSRK